MLKLNAKTAFVHWIIYLLERCLRFMHCSMFHTSKQLILSVVIFYAYLAIFRILYWFHLFWNLIYFRVTDSDWFDFSLVLSNIFHINHCYLMHLWHFQVIHAIQPFHSMFLFVTLPTPKTFRLSKHFCFNFLTIFSVALPIAPTMFQWQSFF